jgi:hypothetical protein
MKKYFVCADVHSFYEPLIEALNDAGFDENNPNHILISCGDLFDRGPDSKKVLDFFYKYMKLHRCRLVKGNHEELFMDIIHNGYFHKYDVSNGTIDTLIQLQTEPSDSRTTLNVYIQNYDKRFDELYSKMKNYIVIDKYVFVHGWWPCAVTKMSGISYSSPIKSSELKNKTEEEWSESRWDNGMADWHNGCTIKGKTVVCGHWHTSYAHVRDKYGWSISPNEGKRLEFADDADFSIYQNKGIIALDACTVYSKKINIFTFETK